MPIYYEALFNFRKAFRGALFGACRGQLLLCAQTYRATVLLLTSACRSCARMGVSVWVQCVAILDY